MKNLDFIVKNALSRVIWRWFAMHREGRGVKRRGKKGKSRWQKWLKSIGEGLRGINHSTIGRKIARHTKS